ncbi:LOW QUALITY PROTEIN: HUWE1-associated protein modifying stress responses [Amblyomma americanum]
MAERADELDSWITNWERQCIEEVERAPDLESQIQNERDTSSQKLWLLFQNSATCVAQLYKDRQHGVSLWVPFQNAASSVTNLYKECLEAQRRVSELGYQSGYQRRTKDLLAWAKKRKRHIRREDLLAFLCGKAPHHHHHHHHGYHGWASPRQRLSLEPGSLRGVVATAAPSARLTPSAGERPTVVGQGDPDDVDLDTFREALAISSALGSSRNHGGGGVSPPGFRSAASLSNFIAEEFARHVESRKRTAPGSASPGDVVMDSPTHKRPRLI